MTTYEADSGIRHSPQAKKIQEYPTGGASFDRGVAITPADGNLWVANSGGSDVSRLTSNGRALRTIRVGGAPTGVAVDDNDKVWVTNWGSNSASRIDPTTNQVDLTVDLGKGPRPTTART
jgi:YVTN family beta-propeller protein